MSGEPFWVIPAITASAGLVGTAVGGLSAYWTSKKSFERTQLSEEKQQNNVLLREAAIRFIAAITEEKVAHTALQRIADQFGDIADRMASAGTDDEFNSLARQIDPSIEPGADRVAVLGHLMRSTGAFDDDLRRAVTLITELRLIAPRDVTESAQRVLYTAASREVAAALVPENQRHATDAFNHEVNEFFNRVRHHMSVEDIEFDFFAGNEAR